MANINEMYMQLLGRNATPDESAYLQKFVDEGSLQGEELNQIIQSMPEFQQRRLESDTTAFGDKLTANDNQFLSNATDRIGAQVNSRFASLGRPVSSAMAASTFGQAGQIAQGLQQNRQSMLADFYGKGLQATRGLQQARGQGAMDRGYGLRDETRRRGWEMEDYHMQKNDYNDYLNAANRRQKQQGFGTAAGAIGGGLLGAYLGGPAGARAGAGAGSSLGGLF